VNLLTYLNKWIKMFDYIALDKSQKMITFYSEGKNYWPYLHGLIEAINRKSDFTIYYVTSDQGDPGLSYKNHKYKSLLIDDGYMRNWFFAYLNTFVLVTTMPDIGNYQLVKSKKTNFFIYTQHSLMSPNCSYRAGSFNNYDIIFCSGEYMINEHRKAESFYNLPEKILVEHGYTKLDKLLNDYSDHIKSYQPQSNHKKALLAPSWNKDGIIESNLLEDIIQKVINQNYLITLRPHPESLKTSSRKLQTILDMFASNPSFNYEDSITSNLSLFESDLLITDWSGISLEYAFALKKPVLYVNTPQKILNPDYENLQIQAFESILREKIGIVWNLNDSIDDLLKDHNTETVNYEQYIFNIGKCDDVGASYIIDLIKKFYN